MQQPLISDKQSSQCIAKYWKIATFAVFLFGVMFVFCQQSWKQMEENAISEPSDESMVGESSVAMREEPAPKDAPLIHAGALTNAELGVPIAMLAYTWRNIPVDDPTDLAVVGMKPREARQNERKEVAAAQKMIPDFPSQPLNLLSKNSIRYHREFLSRGTIKTYNGETRKAVILGFPGTEEGRDIWRDIQAKDSKPWKKVNGEVWTVATGFLTRFHEHMEEEDFRARMLAFVKQERPEYIYIFGHSLGGAVSTIAAADLVTNPHYKGYKVVLITFGAPRVFDQSCAPEVNDFFKKGNPYGHEAWRFVNYGDAVPSLPPSSFGFEHIGRVFYINKPIGGKWTLQEQAQDFTPYHVAGFSLNFKSSSSIGGSFTTHLMGEYKERLAKIHQTAEKEGVFKGLKMKQSSMWQRATSFLPWH